MRGNTVFILAAIVFFGCQTSSFAQASGQALVDLKAAAEAGDPAAQDRLAEQFIMRRDTTQAELWYRKSAEQGYAHAQGKLGDMLLSHSRFTINGKASARAAMGEEAVKWLVLAANQGDGLGQADLAGLSLEGKLVKQDLVEADMWGDLASRGSPFDVATISGRSTRDSAILKMSPDQIEEAKRRAASFQPHVPDKNEIPEPSWVSQIKLSGLSGEADQRLAIINGTTFSKGETASVKVAGKNVKLHCLEIREKSVMVEIENIDEPREIFLTDSRP